MNVANVTVMLWENSKTVSYSRAIIRRASERKGMVRPIDHVSRKYEEMANDTVAQLARMQVPICWMAARHFNWIVNVAGPIRGHRIGGGFLFVYRLNALTSSQK